MGCVGWGGVGWDGMGRVCGVRRGEVGWRGVGCVGVDKRAGGEVIGFMRVGHAIAYLRVLSRTRKSSAVETLRA